MSELDCGVRGVFVAEAVGVWDIILREAATAVLRDRLMSRVVGVLVTPHGDLAGAMACMLARKLNDDGIDRMTLAGLISDAYEDEPDIVAATAADLLAIRDRDPSCEDLLTPFLYFKGFQALQAHRVSHWLWKGGRTHLARHMQSRISEIFGADFHPAARVGRGIMIDHGTGVVIGETAVIEDDVSMLHEVTLGGTGKAGGDRHPKVRRGVLIGAGAKILGNIEVGEGAKVGAGSIVLDDVAPFTTVVGIPARPVGRIAGMAALTMDQTWPHDRSG
ncbi:MAG: serine O-acetyltransferase [Alphaproteobacteria bacterium]|nr:serine O-acetyltransferase [Alphaproteobacteria bacterium]